MIKKKEALKTAIRKYPSIRHRGVPTYKLVRTYIHKPQSETLPSVDIHTHTQRKNMNKV